MQATDTIYDQSVNIGFNLRGFIDPTVRKAVFFVSLFKKGNELLKHPVIVNKPDYVRKMRIHLRSSAVEDVSLLCFHFIVNEIS